jgi:hypothetical protein
MCDMKNDILVRVHIRNIPWAQGCHWNVKVPSSPYKRGCEGTCKQIQNFGNLSHQWEIFSLLLSYCCIWARPPLSLFFVLVLGEPYRIFGYPPNRPLNAPPWSSGLISAYQRWKGAVFGALLFFLMSTTATTKLFQMEKNHKVHTLEQHRQKLYPCIHSRIETKSELIHQNYVLFYYNL